LIWEITGNFAVGQVALAATTGNQLGKFELSYIHVCNPPAKSISLVTQALLPWVSLYERQHVTASTHYSRISF
jgi:hypothetical protein